MTIASLLPKAAACGLRPPEWLKHDTGSGGAMVVPLDGEENTSYWIDAPAAESILRDWAVGVMAEAGIAVSRLNGLWWLSSKSIEAGKEKMVWEWIGPDAHDYPSAVYAAFARFVEGRERSGK